MGKGSYAAHNWVRLCREKDGRDADASTSDDDAADGHAGLNLAEREFLRKVSAKYVSDVCMCVAATRPCIGQQKEGAPRNGSDGGVAYGISYRRLR
jgi:hypothetical protein